MKFILTLTFILICNLLYSQVEIRGTVLSKLTGKKPSEIIYVRELITKQPLTNADSLGQFRIKYLEPNKEYIIEIVAFGFPVHEFKVTTNKGILNEVFILSVDCYYDAEKAESDWKNGDPKILLAGGIAPIGNTKADNRFEKKYKIEYFDFGCTPPAKDCIKLYNTRIMELMDQKYGTEWRKKARPFSHLN